MKKTLAYATALLLAFGSTAYAQGGGGGAAEERAPVGRNVWRLDGRRG